jgi:hypothetical protein
MLQLKGFGAPVVLHLEQIGYNQLSQLADASPTFITKQIAQMLGSNCLPNSPKTIHFIRSIMMLA